MHGLFEPGQRIEEIPLSLELGVSRTPVRAALATLVNERLVEYRPKKGYEIRCFDVEELSSAYEVRSVLEGLACGMAAKKGLSSEQRKALEACLLEGDQILAGGYLDPEDHHSYIEMNTRLHTILLETAGNAWLSRFVELADNIPYASGRIVLWDVEHDLILHSHKDHHRIIEAVFEQDARRAEQLMREHVYYAGKIFRRHYDLRQSAKK